MKYVSRNLRKGCIYLPLFIVLAVCIGCAPHMHIGLCLHGPMQYGEEGSDASLLVISDGHGKYGYCDVNGKVVIKPAYDDADPFHEGLAAVKINDKWGYIDPAGKIAIPLKYYDAFDFHNGKAYVSTELSGVAGEMAYCNCCLIDVHGSLLYQTEYNNVAFSDGVFMARDMYHVEYVDSQYHFMFGKTDDNETYDGFHCGLAAVKCVNSNGDTRYFFIDRSGSRAFPGEYVQVKSFAEGLAPVVAKEDALWGYIDDKGRYTIEPKYLEAYGFGEGIACVLTNDGRWALIDTSGGELCSLPVPINTSGAFSDGLCMVGRTKEKEKTDDNESFSYDWGFMDASGKLVVDFRYDKATPFQNGIAEVLVDGKIGYIDKSGKYIREPQ